MYDTGTKSIISFICSLMVMLLSNESTLFSIALSSASRCFLIASFSLSVHLALRHAKYSFLINHLLMFSYHDVFNAPPERGG